MSGILSEATEAAQSVKSSAQNTGELKFGPVPVGGIGQVSVVARKMGEAEYLYAEFTGSGRPARIPLAACAVLVDALREEESGEEE